MEQETQTPQQPQPRGRISSAHKVALGLIASGAIAISFGLVVTGSAAETGNALGLGNAPDFGSNALPPQAPLDPTATSTPTAEPTPEPTATPEPPTPEPPTPEPPPTEVPPTPRPTSTPRPPAPPPVEAAAPAPPPPPPAPPPSVALNALEQQLFALHNSARASNGLAPLRLDPTLVSIARRRAQDMASRNYFAHTSPTGETAFSIMASLGYGYNIAGENIARNNYADAESASTAMSGFMNSPSHRQNILDSRFNNVGIGLVYGADGMKYFAVVFSGR